MPGLNINSERGQERAPLFFYLGCEALEPHTISGDGKMTGDLPVNFHTHKKYNDRQAKPIVVVPVVRVVPVAVSTASVVLIVVEGTTTQHTAINGHTPAKAEKLRQLPD